jgi:hypothetical protein
MVMILGEDTNGRAKLLGQRSKRVGVFVTSQSVPRIFSWEITLFLSDCKKRCVGVWVF